VGITIKEEREEITMTDEPTKDEMHKSIEPDSTQINADDLIGGPITVKITGVKRGNREQPIQIQLEGYDRVYRPGKSMRRVLIAALGDDPANWLGTRMTLYRDDTVRFGGLVVGGVRISHLSHIEKDMTFLLTATRGKRSEFHIKRLDEPAKPALTEAESKYVADCTKEIAAAESLEALTLISTMLGNKSDAVKNVLRPLYAARKAELTTAE
jgi:hypothetical protein